MLLVLVYGIALLVAVLLSEWSRRTVLALFSILFSDGLKLAVADIRAAWPLPGRALLIGCRS